MKYYTRQKISEIKGTITIRSGKNQRITFIECPNDINAMIDYAKIADLALLLVDGSLGFEMETFEFLSILKVKLRILYSLKIYFFYQKFYIITIAIKKKKIMNKK